MSMDLVYKLDKQQSSPTEGRRCQVDPNHGRLGVHKSGAYLICGAKGCEYVEPASTSGIE